MVAIASGDHLCGDVNAGIKRQKPQTESDPTVEIIWPVLYRRKPVRRLPVHRNFCQRDRLDAGLEVVPHPVGLAPDVHHTSVVEQLRRLSELADTLATNLRRLRTCGGLQTVQLY